MDNLSCATIALLPVWVEEYDAGNGKKARRWARIGAVFPHKEGPGLNVELRALPIDGRIVLLPPNPEGSDKSDRK